MARILVVGSVALDQVVALREPMREGAHLEGEGRGFRLGGGAGNTGGALVHAGHQVLPVAPVGSDEAGQTLLNEMQSVGFDAGLIKMVEGPSTQSIVMVDGQGERTIVNLSRAKDPRPPERLDHVQADCLFVRSRALDLAPLMRRKVSSGLVVAHLPPCGAGMRPAQVLVASESDLSESQLADPWVLGRDAAGDCLEWVVVTRGAKGAEAFAADKRLVVPAPIVSPKDTTGAGDAFAAGLVHGLVQGLDMAESLKIGCAWGAESTQWTSSQLPMEAVHRLTKVKQES